VNIYTFYKREIQCRQMISSTSGFSQSRYLRLIAISSVDVFATVPLATIFIVLDAKEGLKPWKSWADTHSHYSVVPQVAGIVWKNIPTGALGFEIYRWSLVACAFIFFALFGFAVEAREHYYSLYKLLARLVSTSSASHGTPHAYVVRSLCRSVLIHWGSYYSFFAVLHQSLM
jgi:pheromone a factor receptor